MMTDAPPRCAEAFLVSDQSLIEQAQHGSTAAYGELITRYRDGVVNIVYRMCGDPDLAEEAAQEAFLRAWQRLSTYRPEFAFRAWVYRIAMNAALDRLRRDRRLMGIDDVSEERWMVSPDTPEGTVEDRQRASRVRQAVASLSEGSRAVLVLREYGGMSYAEIAAALNIPLGTVMSRLNAARTQLRKELSGVLEVL